MVAFEFLVMLFFWHLSEAKKNQFFIQTTEFKLPENMKNPIIQWMKQTMEKYNISIKWISRVKWIPLINISPFPISITETNPEPHKILKSCVPR